MDEGLSQKDDETDEISDYADCRNSAWLHYGDPEFRQTGGDHGGVLYWRCDWRIGADGLCAARRSRHGHFR